MHICVCVCEDFRDSMHLVYLQLQWYCNYFGLIHVLGYTNQNATITTSANIIGRKYCCKEDIPVKSVIQGIGISLCIGATSILVSLYASINGHEMQ